MSEGTESAERINKSLTGDPYLLQTFLVQPERRMEEMESSVRVLASLESGAETVTQHERPEEIDGSMSALSIAILMAAGISIVLAIAGFAGWLK